MPNIREELAKKMYLIQQNFFRNLPKDHPLYASEENGDTPNDWDAEEWGPEVKELFRQMADVAIEYNRGEKEKL